MPAPDSIHTEDLDLPLGNQHLRARWILPDGRRSAGPMLVFLHEGLGSIAQWRDFPEALARATGFSALVYDRLGHGGSPSLAGPRTMDYLETEATQVLPSVLAACGIEAPILVGHSDGASIALLFAAAFPDAPRAVISEAAHVFLEPVTLAGLRGAKEAFQAGPLRAKLARFHGDKVDALFRGWNDTWLAPESRHWDMTSLLTTIRAPLLMIQGEDDEYGSPAQVHAVVSRVAGPAESMLIPGCGHIPHFQARERVLERAVAFLGAFTAAKK